MVPGGPLALKAVEKIKPHVPELNIGIFDSLDAPNGSFLLHPQCNKKNTFSNKKTSKRSFQKR